jgi:hypothetical protein
MRASVLRGLLAAATVLAACPAGADTPVAACTLPTSEEHPLADRAGLLAQYERMPQSCLREIYKACSDASSQALLDFESAAVCSFTHEALLKQGFGGNFGALIAWWRSQREQPGQ